MCRAIKQIRLRHAACVTLITLLSTATFAPASAASRGLHGRVIGLNEDGRYAGAVSGATIEFKSNGGGAATTATTDQAGRYQVNLPEGQYRYKIEASGFRDEDQQRGISLALPKGYAIYNFSMIRETEEQPPAQPRNLTVLVKVLEKMDHGLRRLPGANVMLRRADKSRANTQRGKTDSKGRTGFKVTELGGYLAVATISGADAKGARVTVTEDTPNEVVIILDRRAEEPPEYQPAPPPEVTIPAPENRTTPETPNTPSRIHVQGYVVVKNGNGHGYTKVPGAKIKWFTRGVTRRSVVSDRQGHFGLTLTPDMYKAAVYPPKGYLRATQAVRVRNGMNTVYLVVDRFSATPDPRPTPTPNPLHQLTVNVLERVPISRTHGLTKHAVIGAKVLVNRRGSRVALGTTGSHGQYSTRLPNGSYHVAVTKPGYRASNVKATMVGNSLKRTVYLTRISSNSDEGTPPGHTSPRRVTVRLSTYQQQNISKTIHATSIALSGVEIIVTRSGRKVTSGRSGKNGQLSLQLSPGKYLLQARRSGFLPATNSLLVSSSGASQKILLRKARRRTPDERIPDVTGIKIPDVTGIKPDWGRIGELSPGGTTRPNTPGATLAPPKGTGKYKFKPFKKR